MSAVAGPQSRASRERPETGRAGCPGSWAVIARAHPGRRGFDRQSHTVAPVTDLGHRCGVIRGDDKVGARIAHGWRTPRQPRPAEPGRYCQHRLARDTGRLTARREHGDGPANHGSPSIVGRILPAPPAPVRATRWWTEHLAYVRHLGPVPDELRQPHGHSCAATQFGVRARFGAHASASDAISRMRRSCCPPPVRRGGPGMYGQCGRHGVVTTPVGSSHSHPRGCSQPVHTVRSCPTGCGLSGAQRQRSRASFPPPSLTVQRRFTWNYRYPRRGVNLATASVIAAAIAGLPV